jgi:hypothetical protein
LIDEIRTVCFPSDKVHHILTGESASNNAISHIKEHLDGKAPAKTTVFGDFEENERS